MHGGASLSTGQQVLHTIQIAGLFMGILGTLMLNYADFTRFAPTRRSVAWGTLWGVPVNWTVFALTSVLVSAGSLSLYGKALFDPADIFAKLSNSVLLLFGGVLLIVAALGVNIVANFVSPAFDLANVRPQHIDFRRGGLIAAVLFAAAQAAVGGLFVPAVLMVLAGSLAGFLVHNRYPARLFMGDAGSNFLGFLLGCLTVAGTFARPQEGYSPFSVLSPLLVMAVPLYDTMSVILIRLREGRSPFQPDRRHFSHRLVDRGLTPPRAVATIDLVTLAGGLGALLLHRTGLYATCVVVAQTICLLGLVAVLAKANLLGR